MAGEGIRRIKKGKERERGPNQTFQDAMLFSFVRKGTPPKIISCYWRKRPS
jgi:hypothetical protein